MIVLGLNGWDDGTHDPAAALVVDGQLASFVEEERISRKRHALSALPAAATDAVLRAAGLSFNDVDIISYGWDLPAYYGRKGSQWTLSDKKFIRKVTGHTATADQRLAWVPHHEAHAASAFLASGMSHARILVVDGQGEQYSVSIYDGSDQRMKLLRQWPANKSIGFFYEAATSFCGFGYLNTGKTMGLAAYGQSDKRPFGLRWADDDIVTPVQDSLDEQAVVRRWLSILEDSFGPPSPPGRELDPFVGYDLGTYDGAQAHRPDVAARVQYTTEQLMIELSAYALRSSESRNLCLAGGVALNCVANGLIVDLCENLFIQPAANDAGVAIGAALVTAVANGDQLKSFPGINIGHSYDNSAIGRFLSDRCNLDIKPAADPVNDAVVRLLRGEIIGWFNGGMEGGPRALGSRSILALPKEKGVKDRVNKAKGREPWRPLAPSLLRTEMVRVFGRDLDSPYMLLSLPLTPPAVAEVPAIAHVDLSSRPQSVASDGGAYSRLLNRVRDETGLGLVLNTSFNGPGEPIVCSPADALRTFMTTGIDALIMGDYILSKGSK